MARAVERGVHALAGGELAQGGHHLPRRGIEGAVRPERARELAPLGHGVDGDHAGAHRLAEEDGGEPDRPLAEHGERVPAGDVEPLERLVGGSRAAGDRRPLFEGELVGERHEGARRHLHVGGVAAVPRQAVDDDPLRAELGPARPAVLAVATALVVVVHHALTDRRVGLRDPRAALEDDAAGLVSGDHGSARAPEAQRLGGAAGPGRAIGMEVAPAQAGGLHLEDHLARPRRGVGEAPELELAVAQEHDSSHRSPSSRQPAVSPRTTPGVPRAARSAARAASSDCSAPRRDAPAIRGSAPRPSGRARRPTRSRARRRSTPAASAASPGEPPRSPHRAGAAPAASPTRGWSPRWLPRTSAGWRRPRHHRA